MDNKLSVGGLHPRPPFGSRSARSPCSPPWQILDPPLIWTLGYFRHDAYVIYVNLFLLAHSKNELMQWRGVRRLSVSVCPSVNFCANRFFSQTNGRIVTKLAHDGLQVRLHPGCAQGQGQRSRDTRTFLHSWNELLRH